MTKICKSSFIVLVLLINHFSIFAQTKSEMFFEIGNYLSISGDFKNAIISYDSAIVLNSKYKEEYYFRGMAYQELEELNIAIGDFNKAIELDSDYLDVYISNAICKNKIKDYKGALIDYSNAIRLDSSNAESYQASGLIKAILYDDSGACLGFKKAKSLYSSNDIDELIRKYCK